MKTNEWTDEDWSIAKQLWDAAADDGIIQADKMLKIAPHNRPELHSVQSMGSAFYALTGKDWDLEKAANRFL